MSDYIDLHTHTTCSDGSFSPEELVAYASKKGLKAIAISDHDSIEGIDAALEAGKKYNIEIVPAIEFSVQSQTETHVLGYYIDHRSPLLKKALDDINETRRIRTENTCKNLQNLGFDVTLEEAFAIAPSGVVGRAHFARILMEKGYTASVKEGFDKYLANGKPAYDGTQFLTAKSAVELINNIGGVSFVAHPHLIRLDDNKLRTFLSELKQYGLCGIEGYYNEYTPEMQDYFQNMAKELELEISGGTDFHGLMKPHIEIGIGQKDKEMHVPYYVLDRIKKLVTENKT